MTREKADTVAREDIFERIDSMIEEASRIINRAEDLRLFLSSTSRQSRVAKEVEREASKWIKSVEARMKSYRPGEALLLTDPYDLMHRVVFQIPADKEFINETILQAFDARIHGDKQVDEYVLYKAIERRIWQRGNPFLDKPLKWLGISLDEWHKQALKGFAHTELSDYDIISRVNILLGSDLAAFEGSKQQIFKQLLFNQYRHYLDYDGPTDLLMSCALNDFRHLSSRFTTAR